MLISKSRRLAVLLFGSTAAMSIAAMPAAASAQPAARLQLRPQSLDAALRAIAQRMNVEIRFDPNLVSGSSSSEVDAAEPLAAIRQALAGTRFTAFIRGNAILVVPSTDEEDIATADIVVTARRDEAELGYLVRNANSSTRDGGSLRDQPQSTTVISNKLLRDQQVQTVPEALRNASGASVNLAEAQGLPTFTVRGFAASPLSGGLNDPGALARPIANVERIEVLKGPAALLSGANNLGGAVNIVTKRPTADPLLQTTAEYGSFDDLRLAIDASGAMNPAETVSARLVGQYAKADRSSAGYDGRIEHLIAPSLRLKDGRLDVTAGAEFSDVRAPAPAYAALNFAGELINVGERAIGPREQGFRTETSRVYYTAEWSPADWLTLVSRSQYSESDVRLKVYAFAQNISPTQALVLKTNEEQRNRIMGTDSYARFNFDTLGVAHALSAGVSISDLKLDNYLPAQSTPPLIGNFFGGGMAAQFTPFAPVTTYNYTAHSDQTGYYAQDLMKLGPVSLLAGIRRNEFESRTVFPTSAPAPSKLSATTLQFGAVVDLTDTISIYGNYMEGFVPQFLLDINEELLPPRESTNIEGGVKLDLLRDRMALTISAYRLRETNVPLVIPGMRNRYSLIEGQESKGIEADLTGQLLPGWNLSASYSYTEYELSQTTATLREVPGQPQHRYNLFTTYEVMHGPLEGLGAGIGVNGFSRSYLNRLGTRTLPSQFRMDANLYYRKDAISLNLGVSNLLDDDIYGVSRTETYIPLTSRRTVRLTLTYDWL